MNIEKLGKTLRKELTRSPKKTAMLALGCVVALYFWAPLIWKWLPGKKPGGGTTAAAPAASAAPLASPTMAIAESQSAAKSAGKHAWNEVVRWMGLDGRTKSATLDAAARNPFRLTPDQRQALAIESTPDIGDPQNPHDESTNAIRQSLDMSPQQLGMKLSGTIVGPRVRVATINGKSYRESAQVAVRIAGNAGNEVDDSDAEDGAGQSPAIEFMLAEVHPHRVVLVRHGKPYELKLQRAKLADNERLILSRGSLADN